jgi:ferredoxin-NADP reductase
VRYTFNKSKENCAMPIYKVKLKCKREIAAETMAFHFEKPEGFAYKAGQSADCTLINPAETDAEGNTRVFSLASAPYEDNLMLALTKIILCWRHGCVILRSSGY